MSGSREEAEGGPLSRNDQEDIRPMPCVSKDLGPKEGWCVIAMMSEIQSHTFKKKVLFFVKAVEVRGVCPEILIKDVYTDC